MATATELPIDTTATATQMAQEMFGNGITLVSASYTGATGASGIYSGGDAIAPGITPSDTGIVLSTGKVVDLTNSSGTGDTNTRADLSTNNATAGDAQLTAVSGMQTYDAAVLTADFIPVGSTLTMQLVFSSDEYLEYVGGGFNDAVGVWVNGVQATLTIGSGEISIDTINPTTNKNLYVDNAATADTYNTEMDGFTVTLTLKAPVNPGVVNTIKIGIADGGDQFYDSNLLIAGNSVQTQLIAGDDTISMHQGQDPTEYDLLANDTSPAGTLSIIEINNQPVTAGQQITLNTGEVLELTPTGFVLISPGASPADHFFTYTVMDGAGNTDVGIVQLTTTPCFAAGTRILTPRGERAVETLRPGDLVVTLDHGPRPLLWVGQSARSWRGRDSPVEIAPGTLGALRPTRLSPLHRVMLRDARAELLFAAPGGEVLLRARDLVNQTTITRHDRGGTVRYVHLMLATHEILIANGILTESFQPGPQAQASFDPAARAALSRLMHRPALRHMPAARPTLKPHEAALLTTNVKEPRQPMPARPHV